MSEAIAAITVNYEPFTCPAGTAVGAAMRELGLPNKGPEAVFVVWGGLGVLFDLAHVSEEGGVFSPVAAC